MAKRKTTKKTSRSGKQASSRKNFKAGQNLRILLASLFLVGFVTLSLVVLVSLRDRLLPFKPELVYEESPADIPVTSTVKYADIFELVENQLINGPRSEGWRRLADDNEVDTRQIFGSFPSSILLDELRLHIARTQSPAHLDVHRQDGIVRLFWADELRLELRYQLPRDIPREGARVAIIMDDMGESLATVKTLLELGVPITPSILPGTGQATAIAHFLQQQRQEYMLHIPMQPRSYPRTDPGANALLLGQSEAETRRLVRSYLQAVPGAVGGNNHMGSRYTEEAGPMRIVLDELRRQGLFFIDSRTIGSSVAFSEARKMGLKTATRNIFLDHRDDTDYIRGQIRKMVRLAGENRDIVAICHPHRATLDALRLEADWLRQQPVRFVAASQLVRTY